MVLLIFIGIITFYHKGSDLDSLKLRDVRGLIPYSPRNLELMSPYHVIERRNFWAWFTAAAIGGFLVAAAGMAGAWWVNACGTTAALATPTCWYAAAGIAVVAGLGTALTAAAGANLGNAKRDDDTLELEIARHGYLGKYHIDEHYNTTAHQKILSILSESHGFSNVRTFTIGTEDVDLNERDGDETEILPNVISWESSYGNHSAAYTNKLIDVIEMAQQIQKSQPIPAGLDNIDHLMGNKTMQKRQNYFDVDYVTWNWDNGNQDLERTLTQDRGMEEMWEYDQEVPDYFHNNGGWKFCGTATVNPNPGQNEGYDQLGQDNALHGEFYFNTYGGVDGYCNDNKDGAQCSDGGCGN
ncbi:hypothetical protein KGF54_003208 [Candida jiufengensis]|uniref:uncharacterized protein n=1 Tax=Candida jiufengensis TaxID=497108 RepID=UPI002224A3B4|nr:uncharacterized protein KGF54_003208 [Candida jiufengensis]KAI5952342.1 hypothetical protein KGF54_003208 [Candida jiufengensis]